MSDDGKSFKIEVPLDVKVREFKSMILNARNQPFFFDFNINDLTIKELLDKSLNKPINITFNYKVYNLYITDGLGNTDFIIKGLSTDSKIENVFGKVAQ